MDMVDYYRYWPNHVRSPYAEQLRVDRVIREILTRRYVKTIISCDTGEIIHKKDFFGLGVKQLVLTLFLYLNPLQSLYKCRDKYLL